MKTTTILLIALVTFCLGALLMHLMSLANKVSRSAFDQLTEQFNIAKSDLGTQHAITARLQQDNSLLSHKLEAEQQTNRSQHAQISELQTQYRGLQSAYTKEQQTNEVQQSEIKQNQDQLLRLNRQLAEHSANNRALIEQMNQQKTAMADLMQQNKGQFMEMAEELLKQNTTKLAADSQIQLEKTLDPLRQRIKSFEEKVERSSKEAISQHSSLKEMVKQVSEQSQRVAADANNLANALKGNYKQQGNWGEMVLQNILDKSGLEKGREYHLQHALRDHEGKLQKPDVVIDLPDNKKLIIDSKVSLVSYDAMVSSTTEEEALTHRKAHAIAIKNHIDGLAAKNYHDLYQIESPDFVLMFIPIDTAYMEAIKANPALFEYAYAKNIVLVTASNLLITLKTVETLWKNDKQNKYALQIAKEAGAMYDKFVLFTEDMTKVGDQINRVQNSYNGAMNKLSTGNGNLIRRAEKIKQLGANANKQLTVG